MFGGRADGHRHNYMSTAGRAASYLGAAASAYYNDLTHGMVRVAEDSTNFLHNAAVDWLPWGGQWEYHRGTAGHVFARVRQAPHGNHVLNKFMEYGKNAFKLSAMYNAGRYAAASVKHYENKENLKEAKLQGLLHKRMYVKTPLRMPLIYKRGRVGPRTAKLSQYLARGGTLRYRRQRKYRRK